MTKRQTGMRLSDEAIALADKMAARMGGNRTSVVELAIRELAESEVQRGRLSRTDVRSWDGEAGDFVAKLLEKQVRLQEQLDDLRESYDNLRDSRPE